MYGNYGGQAAAMAPQYEHAARLAEHARTTNNPLQARTALQQIAGMLDAARDQPQFSAQLRAAATTLDDFRVIQYCGQVAAHFSQLTQQPVAAAPKRRPMIVRKKKDAAPMVLAVIAVLALPALGFAVYKFVIDKQPEKQTAKSDKLTTRDKPSATSSDSTTNAAANSTTGNSDSVASNSIYDGSSNYSAADSNTSSSAVDDDPFAIADSGMLTSVDAAIAKTCRKIKESLSVNDRPTLVVWLFDQTPSAEARRNDAVAALKKFYPLLLTEEQRQAKSGDAKLLTLVGGFANDAAFSGEPIGDVEKALEAMAGVNGDGAGNSEKTFAAIEAAALKIAPFGDPPKLCRLAIVVVTDEEAGDDQDQRDRVAEMVVKHRIPVYVIGSGAQVGPPNAMAAGPEGMQQKPGTESRDPENINLDGPSGPIVAVSSQLPIGPYGLSALCKESNGEYYAITSAGAGSLPLQYYPKYKSEKQYQEELAGNKALQALVAASKLPQVKQLVGAGGGFNVDEAGTPTVADIDRAQRPVALLLPQIIELHETLKKGEADRAKLTEPRQQAAFDTALGRAMAARVRAEGYNTLLAAFKAGRKGTKPETRFWSLMPGDGIEKNSVLDNMAKKAREYLEGVVKNHPNTPWAQAASQELATPIGWVWQEG